MNTMTSVFQHYWTYSKRLMATTWKKCYKNRPASVSKKAYEHWSVSRYLISSFKVEFDNTQFRIPREVSKWMLSIGLSGVHNWQKSNHFITMSKFAVHFLFLNNSHFITHGGTPRLRPLRSWPRASNLDRPRFSVHMYISKYNILRLP